MNLSIEHRTSYRYERPVRSSKNEVRMTPVDTPWQHVEATALMVTPETSHRVAYRDYYGNVVEYFEVSPSHDALDVVQTARVHVEARPEPPSSPDVSAEVLDGTEFLFASPMIVIDAPVARLAATLRTAEAQTTVRAVLDWIRAEMNYETGRTVVGTSVAELLNTRRGVCQDFAHLSCALLRANEIPARYVSGYFAPRPLETGEVVQAQSHAWIEALIPMWGWWAVDPTNHLTASDRHVTVGHGRDYADIVPFQGVHVGAPEQTLDVSVTIRRER